eukprot:12900251-Prorocentrum_lima.AAC.1
MRAPQKPQDQGDCRQKAQRHQLHTCSSLHVSTQRCPVPGHAKLLDESPRIGATEMSGGARDCDRRCVETPSGA